MLDLIAEYKGQSPYEQSLKPKSIKSIGDVIMTFEGREIGRVQSVDLTRLQPISDENRNRRTYNEGTFRTALSRGREGITGELTVESMDTSFFGMSESQFEDAMSVEMGRTAERMRELARSYIGQPNDAYTHLRMMNSCSEILRQQQWLNPEPCSLEPLSPMVSFDVQLSLDEEEQPEVPMVRTTLTKHVEMNQLTMDVGRNLNREIREFQDHIVSEFLTNEYGEIVGAVTNQTISTLDSEFPIVSFKLDIEVEVPGPVHNVIQEFKIASERPPEALKSDATESKEKVIDLIKEYTERYQKEPKRPRIRISNALSEFSQDQDYMAAIIEDTSRRIAEAIDQQLLESIVGVVVEDEDDFESEWVSEQLLRAMPLTHREVREYSIEFERRIEPIYSIGTGQYVEMIARPEMELRCEPSDAIGLMSTGAYMLRSESLGLKDDEWLRMGRDGQIYKYDVIREVGQLIELGGRPLSLRWDYMHLSKSEKWFAHRSDGVRQGVVVEVD